MLWLCYDLRDTLPVVYTNKKYIWNDLIKKKKKNCLSLYFLQVSAKLVLDTQVHCSIFFLLWDCANAHIPAWPISACSVFHFAFPVSQDTTLRCLHHYDCVLSMCNLTSTYTNQNKNMESIRQTDAMVNEAMHGWEGCQGVQMDFDVEHFMT